MDENKLFHASRQMDRETLRSFEEGVSTKVAREIARDHISKPVAFPTTPGETPGLPNYAEPRPLEAVPGVGIMAQMMAQEDRLWRRELANKLGVKAPNGDPPKDAAETDSQSP